MNFYQSFCGLDRKSHVLDGCISPRTKFMFLAKSYDAEDGYDEEFDFTSVINYLPEDFYCDIDNDIIVNSKGAVLEAFDFDGMGNIDDEILNLIIDYQMEYPEYDLELAEDVFPLDTISTDGLIPEVIFSTHVLYVKNYEEILEKNKEFVEEAENAKTYIKKDYI